jgi:predicted nucleic acid-binding protein
MAPESESVFVDTNVLIYSTFEDYEPEKHIRCATALNKLMRSNKTICISSQVLREYFAISTNKTLFKKPLTFKQAAGKMKEFLSRFTLVSEKKSTIHTLITLIEKYSISRQQIHDLNIVATMIDNDISNLLTYNKKDFAQIREINLSSF